MFDFVRINKKLTKNGQYEIYPTFIARKSSDLMIRGGDFYAVWIEELGLWSTDEEDALKIIDNEIERVANECGGIPLCTWNGDSKIIDKWHYYCSKQLRDNFHSLNENLVFANSPTKKEDYASKKLPYSLSKGSISSFDKLISVLYSPEERHKIEWAIGAIVSGDSKTIQKFLVFYGAAGTGKSTILNIIQKLFEGYWAVFDARSLGSSNDSFALEAFRDNPLVAIQQDGDLSRIEDNTRLNSLVSHESMTVNEKFKKAYGMRFNSFLLMGTNKPVKITDARSGLIRRLIDVSPTGDKIPRKEYNKLVSDIDFELGAIAEHCLQVYKENPSYYDDYIPANMMGASNDFFNFIDEYYIQFKNEKDTTLGLAWERYNAYVTDAKVPYPLTKRAFKEELKAYYRDYKDRGYAENGERVRNFYTDFRTDKFEKQEEIPKHDIYQIDFKEQPSIFDLDCSECIAQYATENETPKSKWENVTTKLKDLDTSKLHFVRVPENHIVIDFDIKDSSGNKSFEMNLAEASKWPKTYAELSKSGAGIHLHYIYDGDVSKLSRVYSDDIEIKVFTGNSSLRRRLSKCNDLPIATISSGLPLKGEKVVNFDGIKNEKHLRALIKKNLNKEIHPGTKPSVDLIYKILEDAYTSGMHYDVSDMENAIFTFASKSTNHSDYCTRLVMKMKFKSEEPSEAVNNDDKPIIFYDVEVFPNLFVVVWKAKGEGNKKVRMINPKPWEIEQLCQNRLIGFNCRRYDNHMLYGCMLGYDNEQLYKLSQSIIGDQKSAFFSEAYNISYTDIYDFCATKQSLKKWEIDLGIHHHELGLPWDKPVPENMWETVAEYCEDDVDATESTFNANQGDFMAREILADLAGMSVNDTTNSLSTRIIFGSNKKPQDKFNYRFMGCDDVPSDPESDDFNKFNDKNQPLFPGYKYEANRSTYRGEDVGEGGYVYAEPGIYFDLALLDIRSMHPSSIIAEQLFGEVYTKRFEDILNARVAVKHKDWDTARTILDGALAKYLTDEAIASGIAKSLAYALKIVINSIYGLTAARFDNAFRDKRNIDNIVAKRGALFMVNLKHEVMKRGFKVAHIKTDSIKIPNATPEIIKFVMDYGEKYGYFFEHEATYERMCLVNDAVYIAKFATKEWCEEYYGYSPEENEEEGGNWTATGAQFQQPYVFKYLFSKEPIDFSDVCETKAVQTSLYLDMNENLPDVTNWELIRDLRTAESSNKKLTKREMDILDLNKTYSDEDIQNEIAKGHDYHFVGKIGLFCPIKPGHGGGILLREKDGKYYSATGAKGYRWMESEMVQQLKLEDSIDKSYYTKLVDEAVQDISQYGDFEAFAS